NGSTVLSHSKKRKNTRPPPAMLGSFEAFYQAYPPHIGREDALKAWLNLNPNAELITAIMAADERDAAQVPGTQVCYIKHPSSWLNGKRWTDEPTGNNNGHTKPGQVKELGNGMIEVNGVQMDHRIYERRHGQHAS